MLGIRPHWPTTLLIVIGVLSALAVGPSFRLLPEGNARAQQSPDRILSHPTQTTSQNPRRVALVIGNGNYVNAGLLKNPTNDATDMVSLLTELRFKVLSGTNLSRQAMRSLIREFGQNLKASGGAGLFYFAGHGVQSKGRNYLIPVDAEIQSEAEIEDASVDVNLVLNYMEEAQNELNIVILDACRNNPFARSYRSATNGLAQLDAPTGTLIAYATAPGRIASDGLGRNGVYTAELLKQMRVPGVSLPDLFMRVRAAVMKETDKKQVPWEASSLVGTFYINEATGVQTNIIRTKTNEAEPAAPAVRIRAGPVILQGAGMIYGPKDEGGKVIHVKLRAKIVYFNAEQALRGEVGRLDNDSSHVWDNQWYYLNVPTTAGLLLSWRQIPEGSMAWILVQKSGDVWFYKTNEDKWKELFTGQSAIETWTVGTLKIGIGVEIPPPINGWTTNDVKYSFRY